MDWLEGILYMLWRGVAIGVIISAPMGPVGILCIQRTLAKGRKAGFYTGVGAALSDLFYCLLTGFGLSFIEEFLEKNQNVIQLVGSVVLIAFGVYLFISNPSKSIKKPGEKISGSPKTDILNGFLFTVSNPLIIFLIIGLFARFNFLLPEFTPGHYFMGFLCIIAGALGWWWMVTFFVDKVRAHFNLRSMWFINKITGTIIGIFGIVGVITAIVGLAHAGVRQPSYYNSSRGFGALATETDSDTVMMIAGNVPSTFRHLDIDGSDFRLSFRARSLHNAAGRRYEAVADDGTAMKVMHPAWGLEMTDADGIPLTIWFKTIDDVRDPVGPTALKVVVSIVDSIVAEIALKDKLDWFTGPNSYRLEHSGALWRLSGGEREYAPIWEGELPGYRAVTAGWIAEPGALLDVDWIRLDNLDSPAATQSYLGNPDALKSYLDRSTDPLEGIWEMYDRSLDDDAVRYQGNYRLAIVAAPDGGYEVLYLSGAVANPSMWKPGMLKGYLRKTSFANVYDMEWIDASRNPLDTEIKAEYEQPGLLSVQLPALNSSFRLRRVRQ